MGDVDGVEDDDCQLLGFVAIPIVYIVHIITQKYNLVIKPLSCGSVSDKFTPIFPKYRIQHEHYLKVWFLTLHLKCPFHLVFN